eukprot:569993-Pelagomonas_calceolata.AAC.1
MFRFIFKGSIGIVQKALQGLQTNICFYKVKSHAGIAGNERADAVAEYQASQANNNVADTGIPSAGPGGNPFSHSFWLAKEGKKCWHIHSSCTQS